MALEDGALLTTSPMGCATGLGIVDFGFGFWLDNCGLLVGWNRRAAVQQPIPENVSKSDSNTRSSRVVSVSTSINLLLLCRSVIPLDVVSRALLKDHRSPGDRSG